MKNLLLLVFLLSSFAWTINTQVPQNLKFVENGQTISWSDTTDIGLNEIAFKEGLDKIIYSNRITVKRPAQMSIGRCESMNFIVSDNYMVTIYKSMVTDYVPGKYKEKHLYHYAAVGGLIKPEYRD